MIKISYFAKKFSLDFEETNFNFLHNSIFTFLILQKFKILLRLQVATHALLKASGSRDEQQKISLACVVLIICKKSIKFPWQKPS